MEMERVCVAFLTAFSILLVKLSELAHAQPTTPLTPAMFIFGDSLIDNGNNFIPTMAPANYLPYGIDFLAFQLTGSAMASRWSIMEGARTSFNGYRSQFALTVIAAITTIFWNLWRTHTIAKSVFLINIGSNDYVNNYLLPRRYISSHVYSGDGYADLLFKNLSNQLMDLLYRMVPVVGTEGMEGVEQPCKNRDRYIFCDSFQPTQPSMP